MAKGERGVTKEIKVHQEDQESLDHLAVKESLVVMLEEDLVGRENLAFQEEMDKMVTLVYQEEMEKRETEEKEIFPMKTL